MRDNPEEGTLDPADDVHKRCKNVQSFAIAIVSSNENLPIVFCLFRQNNAHIYFLKQQLFILDEKV